ncbi:MAG: HK97 family phage prohead protease [Proteobacteria bacterium]|nr:MAG: HK97 family phage prohead protease [Pseudomonadota bacterium]
MLYAFTGIEVRSEGGTTRLRASFPYNTETELAPGRREVFASRAFAASVDGGSDVLLLLGHDMGKPLASRAAGTLTLRDSDSALEITATVDGGTSWAKDFLAANAAGLIRGLSPGFRVPAGGERIERRGGGVLRTITTAAVSEFSAVTKPAYAAAQIEARNWQPTLLTAPAPKSHALARWRL